MLGIAPLMWATRLYWWLVLWVLWIPLATIMRCYDLKRLANTAESTVYASAVAGAVGVLYLVVPVISAPLTRSRLAWFSFACLAMLLMGLWRVLYARLVSQPTFARRVLVVGAGEAGQALVQAVDALGTICGVQLLGFVADDPRLQGQRVANRPVLGTYDKLVNLAEQMCVDEIVVSSDSANLSDKLLAVLESCWGRGVAVIPVQLYFEQITGAVMIQHVGQNLFMLMNERDVCLQRIWDVLRRTLDITIGLVGMCILAPLMPLIALAIYLDSPGPIFYRQERVGYWGRTFGIVKFRSMIPNAERGGAVWAKQNDDRITRVGRVLRKTRLDELPQLWNLLVGSMTLIGPRPERPEFVRQLSTELPYYAIRHYLKPGLTGWAQVRYHYGNSVDDALMKLQYDLYYVKHRGPLLDIIILLHTVRVVLALEGT